MCITFQKWIFIEGLVGSYSFLFFSNGKVQETLVKVLREDVEALDLAEQLSKRGDVIVRMGERYVARVKKDNEPFTAEDRYGG